MTRSIDISVEVPGTPEEVWEAIATGPGISAWFVPAEIAVEEGRARLDFGPYGVDESEITDWEPPRRFRAGVGEMAAEWLVEARDGGTCVVRLVNSGFDESAEFDEQYHGTVHGWTVFLENLRLHLTHFRGRQASSATVIAAMPGPHDAAWKALCADLGISPDLDGGDRLETAADAPRLTGTVARVFRKPTVVGYVAVLDGDHPGTAYIAAEATGDEAGVRLFLWLYGDGAADAAGGWKAWSEGRYAVPTMP